MQTGKKREATLWFRAYLRGIETFASRPQKACELKNLEPTYEELKRTFALAFMGVHKDLEPTYEELKPSSLNSIALPTRI